MTDHRIPESSSPQGMQPNVQTNPTSQNSSGDSDEFNIGPLLHAIKEGWKWPVFSGGIFAFFAVVIVLLTQPMFNASGTLYLAAAEKDQSVGSGAVDGISLLSGLMHQGSSLETQVEIIENWDMLRRAILASGINAQVWPIGHPPQTLTFADWKLGGERFGLYAPRTPILRALYAHVVNHDLQGKVLTIRFGREGQYDIFRHQKILLSGKLGQPAIGPDLSFLLRAVQPHYVPPANTQYQMRINNAMTVYKKLHQSGAISVERGTGNETELSKGSYLVTVSVKDKNPFVAQRLSNALMQTYLDQTQSWGTDQAAATYNYLGRQLKKIRTALNTANTRLAHYQSKSGVIAVSAGAKAMIGQMANYETQRSKAKITLYGLQQIQNSLAQNQNNLNPYLFSSNDKVLDSLSSRLADAQSKLEVLQKRYTAAAPEVVEAQAEIASTRAAISTLVNNQEKIATQQLQSIDGIIHQHQAEMSKYPHSELAVISLMQSSEVLGKLYMFLLEKQEEAAITKASTLTKNRVLSPALIDSLPVSPNAKRDVILYGLLGILLGLAIITVRYLFHPGFRSDLEIRQSFPFLPVYGLLPVSSSVKRQKEIQFEMPNPRSGYGEALRVLRGNFYLAVGEKLGQIVAITSSVPGDGKSTLTFQLATALAQDGKKILLVDADLRNPHAHLAFNVPQDPGLVSILAGQTNWEAVLHHLKDTGIDLLTAGQTPPNPSEHLGSPRLEQLLIDLRAYYDFIFVDTPPFPLVGDILTIGRLADRLLTIARIDHTPRRAYQEHLQGLISLNKPLGLIINDIRVHGGYGYGYGYGPGADDDKSHLPAQRWLRIVSFWKRKR